VASGRQRGPGKRSKRRTDQLQWRDRPGTQTHRATEPRNKLPGSRLSATGVYACCEGVRAELRALPVRAGSGVYAVRARLNRCFCYWWSQAGSNRRPLACHASALPAELWPHAKPRQATQPTERCQAAPAAGSANAASIRASVRSRPSSARVASIGGDTAVPVTATRTGCAIFPRPVCASAAKAFRAE
jgi:hypothetical protein